MAARDQSDCPGFPGATCEQLGIGLEGQSLGPVVPSQGNQEISASNACLSRGMPQIQSLIIIFSEDLTASWDIDGYSNHFQVDPPIGDVSDRKGDQWH